MNNCSLDSLTEFELISRLANNPPAQSTEVTIDSLSKLYSEPPREAAVLIPLFQNEGNWHVLFIHRTEDSKEHSGQVAFPGGRLEPRDESVFQTALRETEEEIGLDSDRVKIIARLNPIHTISNYHVTPIVGIIPWPFSYKIQVQEVKHIFTIPLAWLSDPNHREMKTRYFEPLHIDLPVIYYEKYNGELLWGVSARIMVNFIEQLCN